MTNNLKNELEKIKMSKDTKEKIIAACENSVRNRSISKTDNDEYTDHVFTAERIKPKNRLLRSISAVAACAVIAGGIGTTGYLLNRNGSVPATETETTEPVEENKTEITPFGDFSTFDFDVYRGAIREKIEINTETKDNIAVFLNNFNWGEEVPLDDVPEEKIEKEDFDVYSFEWKKDGISYTLAIVDIGFAMSAQYSIPDAENGIPEVENVKSRRINYEAFDRGMKAIIGTEIDDNTITPVLCEKSPFTDLLATDYEISPYTLDYQTPSQEQRDQLAELFESQTWYEFDGTVNYYGWPVHPNRNNLTIKYTEGTTVSYISADFRNTACIYSATYDGDTLVDDDWRFYKCEDMNFGVKICDMFGTSIPDSFRCSEDVPVEMEEEADAPLTSVFEDLSNKDNDITLNKYVNYNWEKEKLTDEQIDKLKQYFETHELKNEDLVPDMWKGFGSQEFCESFGNNFIMIWGDNTFKDLDFSDDRQFIAIHFDSGNAHGYDTKIYKLHDADQLEFLYDILG